MKKLCTVSSALLVSLLLFSFTTGGGDVLEIYLNGKQVHQQFVHVNKSAKLLHIAALGETDKVDVMYSHCGHTGSHRELVFKNENDVTLKTLSFPEAMGERGLMRFYGRDIASAGTLKLYYRSQELPEGRLVATLTKGAREAVARKTSLR